MANITFFGKKGAELAPNPYSHYNGDNIVSASYWPDEENRLPLKHVENSTWVEPNARDGHKAMKFGHNARLYSDGFLTTSPTTTMIYVMMVDHTSLGHNYIDHYGPFKVGTAANGQYYKVQHALGNARAYIWVPGDNGSIYTSHLYFPTLQWMIVSLRFHSTQKWKDGQYNLVLRKNGVDIKSGYIDTYQSYSSGGIQMGYNYEGNEYLYMAEALYYDRLITGGEFDRMELFLSKKYNITLGSV